MFLFVGEPDNWQFCGFKKAGDTRWHNEYCESKFPFYCEDEVILVKEVKPWEEALEYCRNLPQYDPTVNKNHSYDLASPLTLDNIYTQNIIQGGINKVWIGLRYLGDQWLWLNKQSYDRLSKCPPVSRCGRLEKNVTIHIAKRTCEKEHYFLCARK